MSDVYGFRGGPSFSAARREDLFASAMERPMSLGSTFFDQSVGGTVSSYGIGTAYRDAVTPQGNTSELSNMERAGRAAGQLLNPLGAVVGNVKRLMGEAQPSMTEEAYKASPYYRQSVPWDASMTEDRAAALATQWDTKAVRDFYAEKRPITSFFGNLAGQAVDPINYIPVTGPAVRAAAIARMGTVRGIAANAALDASLNTAIAGMATRETRRGFGDDVSWQAMVTEIATAALIGGAFGTVGGVLERRAGTRAATVRQETEQRLQTLRTVQESRVALNEAIGGLANDGEIRLSPNATEPMARIQQEIVYADRQSREDSINRIVNEDMPLGSEPRRPVTLMRFLSGKGVGGIKDESGELAAMGLGRKFIPGGGMLVTKRGKTLDYAREAAAEAGFFDHIYGDPQAALDRSTPDDLLRLLAQEQGGEPAYANRYDGGRKIELDEYELGQKGQEEYRRVLEEVDSAIGEMGIQHKLDDGILRRAAEFMGEDKLDGFTALERAIEEDYRAFADAMDEIGEGFSNDPDFIPFFGDGPEAGGNAGASGIGSTAGRRGANAADRGQSPRAGGNEGQARSVDASPARPDPIPDGRLQAEAKVAKPDDYKALASQYRVDPETGKFDEEAELRQLETEGRLTEEDAADMEAADETYQDSASYGEALKAAVGCLL